MPYSIPWDETEPVGAVTPAADIDEEFQELKIALRERLEQVIPDFGDDLVNPKALAFGTILVSGATVAVTAPASDTFDLTETLNIKADATVAVGEITFDVAGTYLLFAMFKVLVVAPTTQEQVDVDLGGTSVPVFPLMQWRSVDTLLTSIGSAMGFGYVEADVGETLTAEYTIANPDSKSVTVYDFHLLVLRVAS